MDEVLLIKTGQEQHLWRGDLWTEGWRKPIESNRFLVTAWTKALKQDRFGNWEELRTMSESGLSEGREELWEMRVKSKKNKGARLELYSTRKVLWILHVWQKIIRQFWAEKWHNVTTCKTAFSGARPNDGWTLRSLHYLKYAGWRGWCFRVSWK